MMRPKLPKAIFKAKLIIILYDTLKRKKQHLKLKNKSTQKIQDKIQPQKKVINETKKQKHKNNSNVCHIIGSGWSLNSSCKKIKEKDFVIGFNYAGTCNIKFDVYFFEFGGPKVKGISEDHLKIAKHLLKNNTKIYFKNIWEEKNCSAFIEENWIKLATPVYDHSYSIQHHKHLDYILERCLNDNSKYIPQICSTIVTATILAYRSGFTKIVIHGLDFGGKYFYECPNENLNKNLIPQANKEQYYQSTTWKSKHPTAQQTVGMHEITPALKGILNSYGVELMASSDISPAANYLPVYLTG